jgi:hypothetical protein
VVTERRSVRRALGSGATGPLLTALLSTLAAAQALRVWDWRPGSPLGLEGDSTYVAMEIRDILEHGWYWSNPDLGFPFRQAGWLFPDPSLLNTFAVKALGLFSDDPFTISALWLFIGFPLAGLAMYALMRFLGLGRVAGVVGGTLFAVAPGHQTMADHLWLSSYWVLPIGLWLVLTTARGERILTRTRTRLWGLPQWVVSIALLVVLGSGHIYYVAFTLVLLAVVVVVRISSERRLYGVVPAAVAGAVVAVSAVVPLVATRLAARSATVTGQLPATRTPGQSETYAGKLMDLVLPWYGHRVPGLGYLTWAYNLTANRTVERPALGLVALIGVVALVAIALRGMLTGRRENAELLRLSGLTGVTLAFYTVGGLASFVALFFTSQLRTWSRLWIIVFALGMLAVGHWLTGHARRRRTLGWALGAFVLLVGVLDQTNPGEAPDYADLRAQRADLVAYGAAIQGATRVDCPVFQLPVMSFPEASPRGAMKGYDQQLTYAAGGGPGLRWSGGAMHGTPEADWQRAVDPTDVPSMAADLAAVGFCAVEVDAEGYRDTTAEAPALAQQLGAPIAATTDGRFTAYRLPAATDAARRQAVLSPVLVDLAGYLPEVDATGAVSQWLAPRGSLHIANLGKEKIAGLRISFRLSSVRGFPRTLEVRQDGRTLTEATLGAEPSTIELTVDAAPGVTTLQVEVSGDPDIDTQPGEARSALATALTATAPSPEVRVSTGQAEATR